MSLRENRLSGNTISNKNLFVIAVIVLAALLATPLTNPHADIVSSQITMPSIISMYDSVQKTVSIGDTVIIAASETDPRFPTLYAGYSLTGPNTAVLTFTIAITESNGERLTPLVSQIPIELFYPYIPEAIKLSVERDGTVWISDSNEFILAGKI
jgi:hypothetical protein